MKILKKKTITAKQGPKINYSKKKTGGDKDEKSLYHSSNLRNCSWNDRLCEAYDIDKNIRKLAKKIKKNRKGKIESNKNLTHLQKNRL